MRVAPSLAVVVACLVGACAEAPDDAVSGEGEGDEGQGDEGEGEEGEGEGDEGEGEGEDCGVGANEDVEFADAVDVAADTGVLDVGVGDFNGDGRVDVVVANDVVDDDDENSVSIFLSTTAACATTPTFTVPAQLETGANPGFVAVGDLNGDGRDDVVTSNPGGSTISILLNTTAAGGDVASFAEQLELSTLGNPGAVAIGDVDGDGRADVVVTSGSEQIVSVFVNGTVDGTDAAVFALPQFFGVGEFARGVAVGDLNVDGKLDLVVANFVEDTISVLLNETVAGGELLFANHVDVDCFDPSVVVLADVSGDGLIDVVASGNGSFTVLLNETEVGGVRPFFTPTGIGVGVNVTVSDVGVDDIDGDGKLDVVVADSEGGAATVLRSTTTQGGRIFTFAAAEEFPVSSSPSGVALADVNADGRVDVVVGGFGASPFQVLRAGE